MKKNVFLMLAVALFALAACVKESGDRIAPKGEAWLALDINTPTQTRALHNPGDVDYGTADESFVNKVYVYLFSDYDGANFLELHIFNWDKATATIVTKPFLVNASAKSMLVVLNPPSGFPESGSYAVLNAAKSAAVIDVMENGFMMTNATGELETNVENYLRSSEVAAMRAPYLVDVDRVVAKVRVYHNDIPTRSGLGSLQYDTNDIKWGLNITNKKYFPVSKREKTDKQEYYPYFTSWWPDYFYNNGCYRIDPNYSNEENPAFNSTEYNSNFNWEGDGSYEIVFKNLTEGSSGSQEMPEENVEYCLENTFVEGKSYNAWTTQVVVKVQLYGYGGYLPKGESWFNVAGEYYSIAQLKDKIEKEEDLPEYARSITPLVNAFLAANGLSLDAVDTWTKGYTDGIVSFYHEGWNYYKIMIKHDNDTDPANNLLGEYGVVRNSVYDIRIRNINNPGYPVIPDPDPETPNETDETWLNVVININPWTWYTQDEILQ